MTSEQLSNALNNLDDCYIEEYSQLKKQNFRFRKILLSAAAVMLALLLGCVSFLTVHVEAREVVFDWLRQYSYIWDARYLIKQVENTHPCFVLEQVPLEYTEAKQNYLSVIRNEDMSDRRFEVETLRYLSSLNDLGTGLQRKYSCQRILDMELCREDEQLWLLDSETKQKRGILRTIGGVDIETICTVLSQMFPMENENSDALFAPYLRFDDILSLAGVNTDLETISVVWEDSNQQHQSEIALVPYEDYKKTQTKVLPESISSQKLDTVFYIQTYRLDLDRKLSDVCAELSEEIQQGCRSVIIDLRGNDGGDSNAYLKLLEAMDMSPAPYSVLSRSYGSKQCIEAWSDGIAKVNPEVRLIILSDENTAGSAAMFCVLVRDSHLGEVIGRPSYRSPNFYGYGPSFTLPNTQIQGQISSKLWIRPDQHAHSEQLEMDLLVPHGEDIMEIAMKQFNS